MKLKDLEAWKPTVIEYWTQQITASGYDNKIAMIDDLNSKMNSLNLSSYYNNSDLFSKAKDSLFSMMTYVNVKYLTVYANGPIVPDLFENVDLGASGLYTAFSYDLPDPEDLFSFSSSAFLYSGVPVTGTGISGYSHIDTSYQNATYRVSGFSGIDISELPGYGEYSYHGYINYNINIPNIISTSAEADMASIDVLALQVPETLKNSIIYRMFTKEQPKVITKSAKEFILTDLKFNQVLTTFDWTIQGLN